MKKNNLLIGAFAVAVMAFASSCDKNQAAVKDLEGTWKTTGYAVNDSAWDVSEWNSTTTFESCKLKDGACPATAESTTSFELLGSTYETVSSTTLTYTVEEDGTELTTTVVSSTSTTSVDGTPQDPVTSTCDSDCSSTSTIVELDGSTLVTEYTDGGDTYRSTATKQ